MNIQALDIKVGDRIIAYCKNKRQPCTVQRLLDSTPNTITLKVSTCTRVHYRESASCVIQFHREAVVEMANLNRSLSKTI
ncbi:hypothetical protein MC7420_3008 [Coleofasciculus chthonoplastes PCC 7420]|uniref:Uncharacterized protein n=1 Tax=Coleofasciculus chthonoplastes PCC 7420 TaxID=118168 RepID=B4VJT5_9CYAN|nr:hypothetical protein [Coleofasciculus chthonoplastes]EDX77684.1 hypothetical protein MC7420_3008 [Coleofasciculus chthonoplastes PCC 7420]